MKSRITLKLTLYFSATLVLFSIIIGSIFLTLFKNHTIDVHRNDLEKRAETIASTLSEYMSSDRGVEGPRMGMGMSGSQPGYGAYLRFIDDIAMADVWIVDENLNLITSSPMPGTQYNYADLPGDAEKVVKEAFKGNTTFSESFSHLLNSPALTIGTPIRSNGKVLGVLLLHSPVSVTNQAVVQGLKILLISIFSALILAILLSILLVLAFTKPLKKMKESTLRLAGGDYAAKTHVKQKDEIGELADAIDSLSVRLDLAQHEREKLDQLRRDFVANISHELRTPVTVIRGSLEALCDEVVTDPVQVHSYHRQMLSESMFLQRLVNDLLDLSRLQNSDFKMDMQEISLCDVLDDAVRSAGQMARDKGIEIRYHKDAPSCALTGDYGRIRQMFLIILDNAVKFSPENGIVHVTLKDGTVAVKDMGPGISGKDLPYIFDRFYKKRSEENKSGSGLGLAIAKQIADRHRIKISVSSGEGETVFKLEFKGCPALLQPI